jgi:hypothetical protein
MAGGLQQVLVLPGFPGVYRECLPEVVSAVREGEGCDGEVKAVKRAPCVLLAILLCSCAAHHGSDESSDAAETGRLRFLDRSDPLVEHTFEIMEVRADHSEWREILRAEGERVCEEGEHGTRWQEDCNTCWCEWGARRCTHPKTVPPDDDCDEHSNHQIVYERPRDYREIYQSSGRRRCKEHEIGTRWQASCNTCWCEDGFRVCSKAGCPSADHP